MLPSAQHTACTIEMTNLSKRVDVAIIDEIQVLISDCLILYADRADKERH